jgi:hypothetical protein
VDNFVDNATLDRPKRGAAAGFNRMPVAQAKREHHKIKDLHARAQEAHNFFQNFQVKISVHKATMNAPRSSPKDDLIILKCRAMGQRMRQFGCQQPAHAHRQAARNGSRSVVAAAAPVRFQQDAGNHMGPYIARAQEFDGAHRVARLLHRDAALDDVTLGVVVTRFRMAVFKHGASVQESVDHGNSLL